MITRTLASDWLSDVKEGSLFSVVFYIFPADYQLPIFQRTSSLFFFNFEQNHGEMPAVLVLSNSCSILV